MEKETKEKIVHSELTYPAKVEDMAEEDLQILMVVAAEVVEVVLYLL